jgi:hypothetical protein
MLEVVVVARPDRIGTGIFFATSKQTLVPV